jgi:hypothetical protein
MPNIAMTTCNISQRFVKESIAEALHHADVPHSDFEIRLLGSDEESVP